MPGEPTDISLFQSIVVGSAPNGVDSPIEFSSLQTELRNLQVKPEARAQALAWAGEQYPDMRGVLDALATNAGFSFDALQRMAPSVTLDKARLSPSAMEFAPALLAIHGPTIDLTAKGAPLGTLEVRAITNAVGHDRMTAFFEGVLVPKSSGVRVSLSEDGARELGRQAQMHGVTASVLDAFRATLGEPTLTAFNEGTAARRGVRIQKTH